MAHPLAPGAGLPRAAHLAAQTQPISGLSGRTAFVLIAAVVVVIAVIAVIPLIMDVRRATAWRQQLTDHLIDRAATDHEVRDFLRDLREPRGVRGLTRSIIAVLILALVGFALAVAMLSAGADSGDLRKTIVTALMTVLATVAGFYFGTLGAQNSAEDARRHVMAARGTQPKKAVAVTTGGTGEAGAASTGAVAVAGEDSSAVAVVPDATGSGTGTGSPSAEGADTASGQSSAAAAGSAPADAGPATTPPPAAAGPDAGAEPAGA